MPYLSLLLGVGACGADQDRQAPPNPLLQTVAQAPSASTHSLMEALDLESEVERLGRTKSGRIVAIASGAAFEIESGQPVKRNLYAGEGDPLTMGIVHGISARSEGGAWIGTDQGLFMLDDLYVTKSPLDVGGTILSVSDRAEGPLAGLWLASSTGLHRLTDQAIDRYEIEGTESSETKQIAVDTSGTLAAAIVSNQLHLLIDDGGALSSLTPPFGVETVHGVAAGDGAAFAATSSGLFRYRASDDPAWTQFTLAPEGSDAVDVTSVDVDPETNTAWATTANGLVRVPSDGAAEVFDAGGVMASSLFAIDALGDLWVAEGSALLKLESTLGEGQTSYETDVLPWITENCALCHRNQTQNFEDYEVFSAWAEEALSRVRRGDMPRCDGTLRCAESERLSEEDYAVLANWIRDGKQP